MSIAIPWKAELRPAVGIYRRAPYGWQAVIRRKQQSYSKFFADSKLGGEQGALAAAMAWRLRLERRLGGASKGWWMGPRAAGSVRIFEFGGAPIARAILRFQGRTRTKSFSAIRYGREEATRRAQRHLDGWRKEIARECARIAREGRGAA